VSRAVERYSIYRGPGATQRRDCSKKNGGVQEGSRSSVTVRGEGGSSPLCPTARSAPAFVCVEWLSTLLFIRGQGQRNVEIESNFPRKLRDPSR
jgi:hypothetical protein